MKEWFNQNPWLGKFVMIAAGATLAAVILLFVTRGKYEQAVARFNEASAERSRLERLDPFPTEDNFKKMQVYVEGYRADLDKFKAELKTHVLPLPADLPANEFQTRLRQAITETTDKARGAKMKLPEPFFLGFDEFTAALPNATAAPLLGQELTQIQQLMNILIDARVESVVDFKRTPLAEEGGPAKTPTPAPGRKPGPAGSESAKLLERGVVDFRFVAVPSAARKAINQIASATEQIYVIRTLHVRNEKDKGPGRAGGNEPLPAGKEGAAPKQSGNLNFIVGNERVEVAARVEIVRFTY